MHSAGCISSPLSSSPTAMVLLITLPVLHFILMHNSQEYLLKTMASEQERRDNTTKERDIHVDSDIVPKMTSHFESLSEKVKGDDMARSESAAPDSEGGRAGKGEERQVDKEKTGKEEGRDEDTKSKLSLQEISKYRERAQQNSVEAIRAAEERYEKAKELGASKLQEGVREASQYVSEKAAPVKETAVEKSQQGYATAKDTLASASRTAADYTKQTAEKAKDFTLQKAAQTKDAVVSGGETAVHYVGDKAVAAKDVSLESGKEAAQYAGKKAAELKDKSVAAGWTAAHYATEKTVDATKVAAGAVQSAAEYTGEKVMDYTARKKEEAEQELEAKQSSPETKGVAEGKQEKEAKAIEDVEQGFFPRGTAEDKSSGSVGEVLEAVGETVVEIAQATKELVIGKDQTGIEEKVRHGGSPMENTKAEER